MDNKITYRQGFFFPVGLRVFGIVSILFAAGIIATNYQFPVLILVAVFLVLVGLIMFSTKAIQVDSNENKIIFLNNWLGLKQRDTESLTNYCYVSVIGQKYSTTSTNWYSTDLTLKNSFSKYNVILLNKPHLKKLVIASLDKYEDALTEANRLSEYLNFDIVKFDPVRTRGKKVTSNNA